MNEEEYLKQEIADIVIEAEKKAKLSPIPDEELKQRLIVYLKRFRKFLVSLK